MQLAMMGMPYSLQLHLHQKRRWLQLCTRRSLPLSLAMDGFLFLNSVRIKKTLYLFVALPPLKLYDIILFQIGSIRYH